MKKKVKVLDNVEAEKIKEKHHAVFIDEIPFNKSLLFQLDDLSFILQPVYPFGKSLAFECKDSLNQWIENSCFPTNEKMNEQLYLRTSEINRIKNEELSKSIIFKNLQLYSSSHIDNLSIQEIDLLFETLKKSKKLEELKLDFIIFLCFNIKKSSDDIIIRYGVLKQNLFLNPTYEIVIVLEDNKIFRIQEKVFGKWGYPSFQYIKNTFYLNKKIKENESVELFEIN